MYTIIQNPIQPPQAQTFQLLSSQPATLLFFSLNQDCYYYYSSCSTWHSAAAMGGGRRKPRTQRKHFKNSRENVWKPNDSELDNQTAAVSAADSNNPNPTWSPFITENPDFEEFYKGQVIVPAEEWDTLMDCLKEPLPAAFRINSSSQFYTDIREQLEDDFAKSIQAESIDGSELAAIKPLPWYPNNLAWHSNYSRKQLRKYPTLKRFHEFLKLENEIGNITRQEAVSMVPPLFLDVQPEHFILDMCAAPGSKTFQLLEMIHLFTEPGMLPSGMIVANDVDVQRCHLLIHQTKRMSTANLIVTTNEAQHFPGCLKQLEFDRVLCDVPCSGDGTLRKAPDIWRKWNAGMGNGLHGLQVQIAMRGLALLKVGGKMVYSTCSMNPVENEAVVAEILRRCGESVDLVDVSAELPELVRRPGLKKWKVRDKGMWLASYRDVTKSRKAAVVPGMFPSGKAYNDVTAGQSCDNNNNNNGIHNPENESQLTEEDVSDLPLERCMRIVPHDQNTGAFFIAVLQKLSPLPAIEKKPVRLRGKLSPDSNCHSEKVASEVKEDVEGEAADVRDGQVQADVITTDLLDGELPGSESTETAALDSALHKMSIEAEETRPSTDEIAGPEVVKTQKRLQIQGRWIGVDPVIFYEDNSVICRIKEFYGIKESFPFNTHLITRNNDAGSVKRIYYVSKSVKEVLELNLLAGEQLKMASVGIKMFERQSAMEGALSSCAFRISSEGLPLLLPHMTKQILYASPVDFMNLLLHKRIKFENFADAEFGMKASNLMLGCCVVVLNKGSSTDPPPQVDASSIAIGCWRGRTNVSVMVTALDCQEIVERISKRMGCIEGISVLQEKNSPSI